jgi:hypothetical protein
MDAAEEAFNASEEGIKARLAAGFEAERKSTKVA